MWLIRWFGESIKLEKDLVAMNKKKVLMVHNFYQIGGGEHTVFKNEVELLRENGHEVIEYTRSNDELKTSKLKLVLLPLTTIWSWKTFWEVRRIIKKEKIDIVHCHNTFPLISPSVYYAARSMNVPVIQTIHNFRFLCPNGSFFCDGKVCEKCYKKNSFKDAIKNNCYRNSKIQTLVVVAMLKFHRCIGTYKKISYIFLTDFNRRKFDKLIDINSDQVFIKPNFVKEVKTIDYKEDKVFVYASRLEENKGLKLLIKYWKNLSEDYVLHIYGDGPLKEYVEGNASANIIYMGFKEQDEIFKDLSGAMAMVFPSIWYEGFPMIIAESMALGCPVLSSNIGNVGDIVYSSGGGVVFNPYNQDSFNAAIKDIELNNMTYREAARTCYKSILNKYENLANLEDIYEKGGGIDDYTFIYAGRLDTGKGIFELIKLWKTLPAKYVLDIFGDGEAKERVSELVKTEDNIVLHGFINQEELFTRMKKSVALVTPYIWYEGFPMNIAECISMGVPVVSSNEGNAADIVSNSKAGVLFDVNNPKELRNALDDVISNRELYGNNAIEYYKNHLAEEINYSELIEIYDKTKPIK